jgi:hypothetical protein
MRFLINVIDNRANSASPEESAAIDLFNEKLQAGGHLVFAGGLAHPSASTVIDNRGDAPTYDHGPFIEAKEWVAGFWVIDAVDLEAAVDLMVEGSKACNRRLEVRPLLG